MQIIVTNERLSGSAFCYFISFLVEERTLLNQVYHVHNTMIQCLFSLSSEGSLSIIL